jgi:hypothetical protein
MSAVQEAERLSADVAEFQKESAQNTEFMAASHNAVCHPLLIQDLYEVHAQRLFLEHVLVELTLVSYRRTVHVVFWLCIVSGGPSFSGKISSV